MSKPLRSCASRRSFDALSAVWCAVHRELVDALDRGEVGLFEAKDDDQSDDEAKKVDPAAVRHAALNYFWSAHQRAFRALVVSMKV